MSQNIRTPKILSKNDTGRPADSGRMLIQDCAVMAPLPCIVILIHGVNDVAEAFQNLDEGICAGLNDRLGRNDLHPHEWVEHKFQIADIYGLNTTKTSATEDHACIGRVNRSPIIPFYWGYKPVDHAAYTADQQRYRDELRKKGNKADLAYNSYQQDDARIIKNHDNQNLDNLNNWLDPCFAKGGGTFANATTCIPDMFGPGAEGEIIAFLGWEQTRTDFGNGKDWSSPMYQSPHRIYLAYAARRLADLIIAIRKNPSTENDTINIVAHSQGTIITMLANMWAKAEGVEPADCTILNNSPYSLENRTMEDFLPGNHQTDKGRKSTFGNFCRLMATNSHYNNNEIIHSADYIQKITDTGCLALKAQPKQWADQRYCRNNFGKVFNYFTPNDQVVSMAPVQGIGWRGVPDSDYQLMGCNNLYQRVFCKDQKVGAETGYRFTMPAPHPNDPPKNPDYPYSDVTINAPLLPESVTFTLTNQDSQYHQDIAGAQADTTRAVLKNERFIVDVLPIPSTPAFKDSVHGKPLSEQQFNEFQAQLNQQDYAKSPENKRELVEGRIVGSPFTQQWVQFRRRMTEDEIDTFIRRGTSYSQHSSIIASHDVPRKVMPYDLAIGRNVAFEDKDFWDGLLLQADWRRGDLNPDEDVKNYYIKGILPPEFKKMMNKPEHGDKPMPTGEFGVLNDYAPVVTVKDPFSVPYGMKNIDISKIEFTEDLQWPMPEPKV